MNHLSAVLRVKKKSTAKDNLLPAVLKGKKKLRLMYPRCNNLNAAAEALSPVLSQDRQIKAIVLHEMTIHQ